MSVLEKGPGDQKGYGDSPVKKLKLQADGNPFPYEREYNADNGVTDDSKCGFGDGDADQPSSPKKNIGDDGQG